MAKQIGEDTKLTLDLKTIGMIIGFIITLAGMWFGLKADIAEAKELPAPVIAEATSSISCTVNLYLFCTSFKVAIAFSSTSVLLHNNTQMSFRYFFVNFHMVFLFY